MERALAPALVVLAVGGGVLRDVVNFFFLALFWHVLFVLPVVPAPICWLVCRVVQCSFLFGFS